jgi:Domain of unknown function (DUF932)
MTTLMKASNQWASRPDDERFASLYDMRTSMHSLRDRSTGDVISNRKLELFPVADDPTHRGLRIGVNSGSLAGLEMGPTHHAFGQLCSLASPGNSPAAYFRESGLPAEAIAFDLNYNLRFTRDVESVGVLGVHGEGNEGGTLRAATGPNYGRVSNAEVVDALIDNFGDGTSGKFRVPGEFGQRVTVDKRNTTLFASDRDMFVFLADEEDRIEHAGRSLARGVFLWNSSQEGNTSLGLGFFLFDYVCCNRIVWGADKYTEVRVRHTKAAPDRWLEEIQPALLEYASGSSAPVIEAIDHARSVKLEDDIDAFIANRFGKRMVAPIMAIHEVEEGRPIETAWDVTVAATAHARSIPNTDKRLEIERAAGQLLQAAEHPRSIPKTDRRIDFQRLTNELLEIA